LAGSPASAHAELVGSDPAGGAVVATAPDVVALRFSEDVPANFRSARLVTGSGRTVTGTRLLPQPDQPRLLTLRIPPVAAGTYLVLWQVLAEDDGHVTNGVLV